MNGPMPAFRVVLTFMRVVLRGVCGPNCPGTLPQYSPRRGRRGPAAKLFTRPRPEILYGVARFLEIRPAVYV